MLEILCPLTLPRVLLKLTCKILITMYQLKGWSIYIERLITLIKQILFFYKLTVHLEICFNHKTRKFYLLGRFQSICYFYAISVVNFNFIQKDHLRFSVKIGVFLYADLNVEDKQNFQYIITFSFSWRIVKMWLRQAQKERFVQFYGQILLMTEHVNNDLQSSMLEISC